MERKVPKPMFTTESIGKEINGLLSRLSEEGKLDDFLKELQQTALDSFSKSDLTFDQVQALKPSEFANMSYFSRFETANLFNTNLSMFEEAVSMGVAIAAKNDLPMHGTMLAASQIFRENEYLKALLYSSEHGAFNHGNMMATLFPIYHTLKQAPTMVFDDDLIRELQLTDLSSNVPAHYFLPPFSMVNIQFGNVGSDALSDEYTVHNDETGYHKLEGALIHVHNPAYDTVSPDTKARMNLSENSDIRSIDIMFYAKPKATLLDDAVSHFNLTFDLNSDDSLLEVLSEYLDYYIQGAPHFQRMPAMKKPEMERNMALLVRCLVYLNCADCRKIDIKERTEAIAKANRLINKAKKRKALKQARYTQDFILIKPTENSPKLTSDSDSNRKVAAHWKRGHMKMQPYGEGRKLRKLIHIKPYIVGMKSDADTPKQKTYKVK